MSKMSCSTKKNELSKRQTNRNPRTEEYNDWTEEFNTELQHQAQCSRKKTRELENRLFEIIQSEEQKKNEKE